jgi:hypothetical protein
LQSVAAPIAIALAKRLVAELFTEKAGASSRTPQNSITNRGAVAHAPGAIADGNAIAGLSAKFHFVLRGIMQTKDTK